MAEKHLKKCSTFSHQGNANQNHFEILPSQLSHVLLILAIHAVVRQNFKVILQEEHSAMAGRSANLKHHCGYQHGGSSENQEQIYFQTSYTILGNILKGYSILLQGHLFNSVHRIFIHNSQRLQSTLMSLNQAMNK